MLSTTLHFAWSAFFGMIAATALIILVQTFFLWKFSDLEIMQLPSVPKCSNVVTLMWRERYKVIHTLGTLSSRPVGQATLNDAKEDMAGLAKVPKMRQKHDDE